MKERLECEKKKAKEELEAKIKANQDMAKKKAAETAAAQKLEEGKKAIEEAKCHLASARCVFEEAKKTVSES